MELLNQIFGEGRELEWWQMSSRAFVVFILCLILLRISGRRSFGIRTAFDNTTAILLGAILSRTVTGASAFFPTLAASLVLVLMHRLLAWLSVRSPAISRFASGSPLLLFKDGKILEKNLGRSLLSEEDIREGLRLQEKTERIDDVDAMYLERSGQISVVKKQ